MSTCYATSLKQVSPVFCNHPLRFTTSCWISEIKKDKNETNQLVETIDQFADRWETLLMNISKNYREEIGVLREQILQFSSTNTG